VRHYRNPINRLPVHIDQDTLADLVGLGPLRTANGDNDLLKFFDRTVTAGGQRRLSDHFLRPLTSTALIAARQQTLRALNSLNPRLQLTGVDRFITVSTHYLLSSYQRLPTTRIDCWLYRHRYPEAATFVASGLHATRGFLEIASQILHSLEFISGESDELSAISLALQHCVGIDACAQLRDLNPSTVSYLSFVRRDSLIRDHRAEFTEAIAAIHGLDALLSLAAVSDNPNFSFPNLVDSEHSFVQVTGLFHPILGNRHTYDVSLPVACPVFFLTGPNTAGKSTLLRALGIVVLMAHVGMAVPAREATLSVYDRLFSSLNSRDSLSRGDSHFLAEVRRIVQLLEHVAKGDRVFALLDEIFKSTNIKDACDGTGVVVTNLSKSRVGSFIVASHLADLATNFRRETGIRMYRLEATVKPGSVEFPRILESGVSEQRLGMLLLEREGAIALLRRIADASPAGQDS
jgi:DNA mismatch repair protein MutS